MNYKLARRIAAMVQLGHSYLYTDRDIQNAISQMEKSALFGRGLPTFDADLTALYTEQDNRKQGTE